MHSLDASETDGEASTVAVCPPTDVSDTNLETQAVANVTVVAHIDDTFGGTSGSDSALGRNIAATWYSELDGETRSLMYIRFGVLEGEG